MTDRRYVPAAGHDWLLFTYDPLSRLTGAEAAHRQLVEQADIASHHRVLDIGCGTGNLTLLVKRRHPQADVVGLDPDARALARARRKAEREGLALELHEGFSDALQFPDGSFDRVVSAFMLHHLSADEKAKTLREARRVLREGGRLHVMDFAATGHGFLAHLFHHHLHGQEQIPALLREAGFGDSREVAERRTLLGRVAYHRAVR
jgi:ubiquinone/menaquinone biosynthesis C-methylase UbiE